MQFKRVAGEVEQPQIIIDAENILDLLIRAEVMMTAVEEVSPKWLKYCHYNDDRRCFEANEGYKHNDILIRKYGFKFKNKKHYDTRRHQTCS